MILMEDLPSDADFPPETLQRREAYTLTDCEFYYKGAFFSSGTISGFAYYYDLDDSEIDFVTMIVWKNRKGKELELSGSGDLGEIALQVKQHLEPKRYIHGIK